MSADLSPPLSYDELCMCTDEVKMRLERGAVGSWACCSSLCLKAVNPPLLLLSREWSVW